MANKQFKTDIVIGGKVASSLSKALGNAQKQVASASKALGKATLAMGTAAAAGVVAITTSAVKSYAEYEQLVGGVETLFGESSQKLMEYANGAYKTAGLSANEYMSTVTSFSASMINSLGGNTAKAAEYSNQAITDMSDNANKMGTDMESIMNTYQSLAKGNFGMLDNLKLGYGGTKTEMQRLLKEATKISGIKYDISSFADITQAIHVIQTEMGITGTTAKEASSTIQGSFGMLSASWKNLLTGMADENADFDTLLTNVIDSIGTVAQNLLPRISVVIGGIFKLVDGLLPQIPALLEQLLPQVISGAVALVQGVAQALPQLVQFIAEQLPVLATTILDALPQMISTIVSALPTMIPALIGGIIGVFTTLAGSFGQIIQPIIDSLPDIITSLVGALTNNLPAIIQGVIQLVIGIVQALPQIMAAFYQATPMVWQMIAQGLWQSLPVLLSGLVQMVKACWDALVSMFTTVGTAIGNAIWGAIKGVINVVVGFAEGLINGFIASINLAIGLINKIPGVEIPLIPTLNIPRLATGGNFDGRHPQLAVVGDAPETMVPHGNTPRNRALLSEAAKGVGVGVGGSNVNITFAPVINGGSGAEVRQALKESETEFERKMDAYFRKRGRVSFA